jgi:hypothetical protein
MPAFACLDSRCAGTYDDNKGPRTQGSRKARQGNRKREEVTMDLELRYCSM